MPTELTEKPVVNVFFCSVTEKILETCQNNCINYSNYIGGTELNKRLREYAIKKYIQIKYILKADIVCVK